MPSNVERQRASDRAVKRAKQMPRKAEAEVEDAPEGVAEAMASPEPTRGAPDRMKVRAGSSWQFVIRHGEMRNRGTKRDRI